MTKRALLVAAVVVSAAFAARAQLVESIEVRVTNVDVVVTDARGNPIQGLKKEDFELRENGKPQKISNFYEIIGSGAPVSAPAAVVADDTFAPPPSTLRRRVIVFIDSYTVDPIRRNQVFDALEKELNDLLRDGDELMLAVWNRRLQVLRPLTSSRDEIRAAIRALPKQIGEGNFLTMERERIERNARDLRDASRSNPRLYPMQDAYRDATISAVAFADMLYMRQKGLVTAVERTIATLAGLEGRKILLYVGGNLQENVGLDAFLSVDAVFAPERVVVGTARGREQRLMHPYFQALGKKANADGVTMYLIDTGDRGARMRDASTDTIEGDSEAEFEVASATVMAMGTLAHLTGGTVLSGTRNFKASLDTIIRDLGSYYSLGYRSEAKGDETRNIAVRVNRPGIHVRARRSFTQKSAEDDMRDRVVANAFHPVANELAISVEAGKGEQHRGGIKVPITITFPSDVTLLPQGDALVGEFAVYIVVANPLGDTSSIGKDVQRISIPAKVADAIRQKPFVYTSAVVVRKGEQSISVGIVDTVSGRSGFAKTKIVAQ